MSAQPIGVSASPPSNDFSNFMSTNNAGSTDFNFDFTKFGVPSATATSSTSSNTRAGAFSAKRATSSGTQSSAQSSTNRHNSRSSSPRTSISSARTSTGQTRKGTASPPKSETSAPTDGMFSPEFLHLIDNSDNAFGAGGSYNYDMISPVNVNADTSMSTKASNNTKTTSVSTSSESASPYDSNTNCQSTSSCGTSPEPFKAYDNVNDKFAPSMSTPHSPCDNHMLIPLIDSAFSTAPNNDFNSLDWMASQNGGTFDPVLFGDYRDTQDAIVGGGDFSNGLFDDSFASFNNTFPFADTQPAPSAQVPAQTACQKLMERVNQCAEGLTNDPLLIVPGEEQKTSASAEEESENYLTAHNLWYVLSSATTPSSATLTHNPCRSSLQTCPKYQAGELDIDNLCTQLTATAKCSEYGQGMILPKDKVEAALWKLVGPQHTQGAGEQ